MSGLQASISTHIGKAYKFPNGQWGYNIPLYYYAVGNHPERIQNLYFTFLFLLRAVMKAQPLFLTFPYITGDSREEDAIRNLMKRLVTSAEDEKKQEADSFISLNSADVLYTPKNNQAIQECSYGFNESVMFQVIVLSE
jgi:hypothetical protein